MRVFNALVDVLEASPSGWAIPAAECGEQRDLGVEAKLRDLAEAYRSGFVLPSEWRLANEHLKADRILGRAFDPDPPDSEEGDAQAAGSFRQACMDHGRLRLHSHLFPHGPRTPARAPRVLVGGERLHPQLDLQDAVPTIILVDPVALTAAWAMTARSRVEQRATALTQLAPSGSIFRIHVQLLQAEHSIVISCEEQSFNLGNIAKVLPRPPKFALAGLVKATEDMQQLLASQPRDALPCRIMQRCWLLYQYKVDPDFFLGIIWIRWLPNGPALAVANHIDVSSPIRLSWRDLADRRLMSPHEQDGQQGILFDTALWAKAQMAGCRNRCIPGKILHLTACCPLFAGLPQTALWISDGEDLSCNNHHNVTLEPHRT